METGGKFTHRDSLRAIPDTGLVTRERAWPRPTAFPHAYRVGATLYEVRGSHLCSVGRSRQVIRIAAEANTPEGHASAARYSRAQAVIRTRRFRDFVMEQNRSYARSFCGEIDRRAICDSQNINFLRDGFVDLIPEGFSLCPPSILADAACDISKRSEIVVGLHVDQFITRRLKCLSANGNSFSEKP